MAGPVKVPSIGLFLLDVIGLVAAVCIMHGIRLGRWQPDSAWALLFVAIIVLLSFYIMNLYMAESSEPLIQVFIRLVFAVAIAGSVLILYSYVIGVVQLRQSPLFWRSVMPFALIGFSLWACFHRFLFWRSLREIQRKRNWLVIGGGERAMRFLSEFRRSQLQGQIISYHAIAAEPGGKTASADLDAVLTGDLTGVIVAADTDLDDMAIKSLMRARLRGLRVLDLTEFYEYYWQRIPLFHVRDDWIVYSDGFRLLRQGYRSRMKRLLDYAVAGVVSIIALPFLLLIAAAIKLDSPGPVIYRQQRIGKARQPIDVYKLRTMVEDAEDQGEEKWSGENDERVTRVGRFLRRFRLDELPQFWNVLRGEMSCFGPRPERPELTRLLEREIPYYDLRHLIKPGITGWAQVMHPYGASVEAAGRKLEYDLYYIKNQSFLLDIFIAVKTIRVMLFGVGS